MRRVLSAVILAVVGCGAILAQSAEQFSSCMDKANTQLAMNVCASEELMRLDTQLNDTNRKLLAAAGKEPGAVEAIMAAGKAWVDYRNAYMNAMYPAKDKQAAYGSIFPTEYALIRASLTQQQIEALKELLKRYGESN